MQQRRDRSSHRNLVLACLTALLTGLLLGLTSSASAVNAPVIDPVDELVNDTAFSWSWSGEGAVETTTCEVSTPAGTRAPVDCTSPFSTTLAEGDGEYALTVHVSGTVDGVATSASSLPSRTVLDTSAPVVTITDGPADRDVDRTPTWTIGLPEGGSATCTLTHADGATVGGPCAAGPWTADLNGQPEGSWTLTVTTEDAAGNPGTATAAPYVLDVAPGAPAVSAPASAGSDTSPAWSIAVPSDATASCTLSGPGGVQVAGEACADGYAPTLTGGDGQYELSVVLQDLGGTSDPGTALYLLDTQAPNQPSVDGPSGRSNAERVTWLFAVPDGTSAECTVSKDRVAGTPSTCGPDLTLPVTDGVWSLSVVLVDVAGNRSTAGVSPEVTIDQTPPPAPRITSAPTTPNSGGGTQSFTWNWTADDLTLVYCQVSHEGVVLQAWAPCVEGTLTLSTANLADGAVSLELRSQDDLGNAAAAPTSTVVLDTTAPGAPVVTGTSGAGSNPVAVWSWTQDATDRATCRLYRDDVLQGKGTWSTCTSGTERTLTTDGTWKLEVRLTDAAGNTGDPAFSPAYLLDRLAPSTPGITGPSGPGNDATVSWAVTGEAGTTVFCQLLDGTTVVEPFADCGWTVARTLTDEGDWSLQAYLVDAAGNTSGTATSGTYSLDLTVPTAPAVAGPTGPSDVTTVTWTWTWDGTESVVAACRLLHDTDAGGVLDDDTVVQDWAACSASETRSLTGDGEWHWQVRLTDDAGNTSPVGTSPAYLLDTLDPAAPVVTAPAASGSSRTPVFTIEGEELAAVECRVVSGTTVYADWATCEREHTVDLTGAPEGPYAVEAVLVDAAGNRSAVGASSAYVLDTIRPQAPVVSGASGDSSSPNPTWSWTGEDVAAQCRLLLSGTAHTSWAACGTPWNPTLTSEGTWNAEVRLVDLAGNVGDAAVGPEYRYDATRPAAPGVAVAPTSPGRDVTPTWTVTGESTATASCRLTGPDAVGTWADCASPVVTDLTDRPQGLYVLDVQLTDAAGNTSDTGSGSYLLDTIAPGPATVTASPSPSSLGATSWTVTASEDGARGACRLLRGSTVVQDWAACPVSTTGSTWSADLTGLADGRYRLEVRLSDAAGNVSTTAGADYVYDTTAPVAVTTTPPPSPGTDRTPTWLLSAEPDAAVQCRFSPATVFTACTTSTSYVADLSTAADGTFALAVRAVDLAGNVGPATSTTYTLDTTAPAAPAVTGTSGAGSGPVAVWSWAQEATDRAECRLYLDDVVQDAGAWTACTSGSERTLTSDGTWKLEVRLTDAAGNTGAAALSPTYLLDRKAPATPGITGPFGPGNDTTVTWTVTGEPGTTVFCQLLDGTTVVEPWATCGRTVDRTLPREGEWSLQAYLVDAAGNTSPTAASAVYALDLTVPTAPAVSGPTGPSDTTAVTWTWTWDGTESVVAQCRLLHDTDVDTSFRDDTVVQDWARCSASERVTLGTDGVWHWRVRLIDTAGNVGPAGTSPAYLLDTVDPAAPVVTAPASYGSSRTPVFTISGEAGAAVQCRVLSGKTVFRDWATCQRQHTVDLTGAPQGPYSVEAVLIDAAGNRSAVGASSSYVLDTIRPVAPVVSGSSGDSPSPTPTWSWTGEDVAAQCRLLLSGVAHTAWAACSTPWTPTLPQEGTWNAEVRLVDLAGNTSAPTTGPTYRYDATSPAAPAVQVSPASPGRDVTPTWTFTGESTATAACRLLGPDGGSAWAPCTSPLVTDLTGRPQGQYALEVRLTDAAGNTSATGSASYLLDTIAPAAATVTATPSPSSVGPTTWTLLVHETGLTSRCRLLRDGTVVRGWASCPVSTSGTTWSIDLTGSPDGNYRLDVRLSDLAGNVSAVSSDTYVYDTTAPVAVLTTPPLSPGSSRTPTWILSGEQGATLQCRFSTSAAYGPCTSGTSHTADLSASPDGEYSLAVRAVDRAGNVGPETVTTYVLDTTAPVAPVVTGPAISPAQDRTPVWSFTSEAGASAHCTLTRDSSVVVSSDTCSGSFTPTLATDGAYLLSVTVTDSAGNASTAGTSSYVLDTTAPAPPVIVGPSSPSSLSDPVLGFDAEAGALVECRVSFGATDDSLAPIGSWATCDQGYVELSADQEGTYRLEVRATDAAGNTSDVAAYLYEYDLSAPAGLQDLVLPVSPGNDRLPVWTYTSPPGSSTTCRLTDPDGRVVQGLCSGTGFEPRKELRRDGRYVLRIVVVDENGNVGTNDLLYVLDTAGPEAPSVTPTGATGTAGQVQWDWVGDPTARWQCELRLGGRVVQQFADCAPGVQVLGQWGEGTYTLTVVGFDPVGNRGDEASGSYTWDAAGPAALGVTTTSPTTGGPGPVIWAFRIPSDAVVVVCGVRRDGAFVAALTSCRSGSYVMNLTGQAPGTYEVVVRFSDSLGNTTEQVRTYVLVAATAGPAPVRPRPVLNDDPTPGRPPAAAPPAEREPVTAGRSAAVAPAAAAPAAVPAVQERLRALEGLSSGPSSGASDSGGAAVEAEQAEQAEGAGPGLNLAGGRGLSGATAVDAIKDVATSTIRRPQLPIILILLVVGFLLVQNRIDRRDPKLAGAPVDEDADLEFRPLRPGRTGPPRPRAGGAPA